MPLRSYYDGSKTTALTMSLACVAADDPIWSKIEAKWEDILERYGIPYVHMKELMPLVGPFQGWTAPRRDALLTEIVEFFREFRPETRINIFTCSIDLVEHRKWASIRKHPAPERLCARMIFPMVMDWYAEFPETILDVMEVYFDRDEPFMAHIAEDWRTKSIRKQHPAWDLIRTIAPADMRLTPPLQVADMMAWARNRIESTKAGSDSFLRLAWDITNSIHGVHREIGEKAMRLSTFSEEGLRRVNAAKRKNK